ncbi:MAG: ABC-2 family transporter protein [candidate division WS2 bacterium ADurb.Bin280]|uniref:ABC-2 family transporter protein n=1 Tax=candidate division WS2 bacterium ADurb.Bin280 TaxID=1852829 RepID=A0A1V5SCR8_9BACT|nr:MAG: ABC-2 family transporter protein [candidate division WS2 bacterium ADurb.Bin280]
MKKFFLLLKKEIKEMLSPQLWIPFVAVMVVFFIVGNVASKQMQQQSKEKEKILVADLDNSLLSKNSIDAIATVADVVNAKSSGGVHLLNEMNEQKINSALIISRGYERDLLSGKKAQIQTYALFNNFSVLAGKKLAIADASTAIINEYVSSIMINIATSSNKSDNLKRPIEVKTFVGSNDKIVQGNSTDLLSYILSQTTIVPVVLFVIIIMASQMIASAVATEKENKTLETLLSLPISRKTIVTSKMLSAGLVSLLMAGIYMLAFKNMNSGVSGAMSGISVGENISELASELGLKITTIGYLELGAILFLAILLALSIAMILGAFAEDAKSAQGVVAPLMILVMIPYFITLFMDINSLSEPIRYVIYAIPFSHIFLAMPNILLANHNAILAGGLYMLILFVVFVYLGAKIFSSDLILTMKLNFSKNKTKSVSK